MNWRRILLAVTTAVVWLTSFAQTFSLYTWVDEQGTVHYSDSPPPHKVQEDTSNMPSAPAKPKAENAPTTTPPRVVVPSVQARPGAEARRPGPGASKETNRLGAEGVLLIRKGRMDEGLALVKRATQLAPEDPSWHMSYASTLFMKGQAVIRAGKRDEGKVIFREVERELVMAIKFFTETDRQVVSHCYFLLGDVYSVAFQDHAKATTFYQTALKYNPDHPGAIDALKRTARQKPAILHPDGHPPQGGVVSPR